MPKRSSKEPPCNPATEESLRRIEETREKGSRKLDLSELELRTLPEAIGQLAKLQVLDLSGNQLSALPEAVGLLSKLETLRLSDNRMNALPEAIGLLTRLQVLNLSKSSLSALPEAIGQLSRLQVLNLSKNSLSALPEAIGQLSRLQVLDLSGNQLSTLPEAIGQLSRLQVLDLSGNQLSALPEAIGQLSQLETLRLSDNRLSALPVAIGQLSRLRELNLSKNSLRTLPEAIGQLSRLQKLDLSKNSLRMLPEAIGRISQVQELDLSGNQLSTLPEAIGQLSQLQVLDLSSDQLKLDLSGNQLWTLPEAIGQLSQLQVLDLSGYQLSTLPEAVGQLSQLETLRLSDNRLRKLPEAIGQLSRLQELNLSKNSLRTLPEAIGRLALLQELDLSVNRLRSLPEAVQSLERLEKVFLQGNPGLGLPEEVLGSTKPSREILDYYFATRGAQGRALREVKLIVVGRGGAGKTSLVKRLKGEPFDWQESETHGINIRELDLSCADGPVQARVWDFGGQHVLHAMHEFFLTTRSLYLLVLEQRSDRAETDAKYWLQLIRSYAGPVPVVVALNKSAGRAREMDHRGLEGKYGPIVAWVPTECSESDPTKSGIDALCAAFTKATDGMEEVRRRFPAKWFDIKKWLGGMEDSYIDYTTYATRCAELGEPDPAKQEELAAWLHDLGVALNFGRDPRLRDTTVLRPDWLANGIYAVLRANDTRHKKPLAPDGIVTRKSLGRIYIAAEKLEMLKAKDYPQEKWPFVLRLMSLFQLSFPLDEGGQRQLVPALLPVEEPSVATEPEGAGRVRLRYEFNVVPASLVPRLLVRTFGLIKNAFHWRRGALLCYGPATAKVWATQDERWIYATISGSQEARDDLTMILRETLRVLFAEYKNLSVVEQMEWKGEWVPHATLENMGIIPADENS
jgi:internalin A